MASQTLVLVVLPNGLAPSGKLRASLYLSPRLAGAATLNDFPDFLDWPDLIKRKGLTFTLSCSGGTTTAGVSTSELRPDLWKEIFKPQTFVAPPAIPDFNKRLVVSYPTKDALNYLQWAYQFNGARGGRGDLRTFSQLFEDLVFRDGKVSTIDSVISATRIEMWRAQLAGGIPQVPDTRASFGATAALLQKPAGTRDMAARVALYHRMPPAPGAAPLPNTPEGFAKTLDFHQALSSLAAYPALMRAMGLVFDVELPAAFCPASPVMPAGTYGGLQISAVEPGWAWHVSPALSTPSTAYFLQGGRFDAAPATPPNDAQSGNFQPSDISLGYLVLSPDLFGVSGVDMDGAMLKALGLADNFAAIEDKSRIDTVLPSLRSGGISLLANDRAQELLRSISDNTAFLQAEQGGTSFPRALTARDLVRGYRLDIWSESDATWRSLHRRNGTYRFGADGGVVFPTQDEEGFTQLAVTQPTPDPTRPEDPAATAAGAPQPGTDLYIHERIARWRGWSLSAPRPGTPLNPSPDPTIAADPDPTANQPITPFKLQASFTPRAGSLPRLRFGERYRIRARAADLAGNSPALSDAVPDNFVAPSGNPLSYLRFESISSPVFVLRQPPSRGASLLRMVIRSYNSAPNLDTAGTGQTDERHLVPPKADVLLVEHHGMLDDAHHKLRGDAATYDLVVQRDKGAFPKVDQTPIDAAAQATTPYFPDPLARAVSIANLPNTPDNTTGRLQGNSLRYDVLPDVVPRPGSVTRIEFSGAWPNLMPLRLVLVEGTAAPVWNAALRTLTVSLAKSQVLTVPVSCCLNPADLDLMGVWDWMRAYFEAAEAAAMQFPGAGSAVVEAAGRRALLTRLALEGGHEMITPAEMLTLVHAVQQPIGRPAWAFLPVTRPAGAPATSNLSNAFSPITAWRSLGSHHAVLFGGLKIHGASSSRIDLSSRWTEFIDDTRKPGPTTASHADHVETIELRTLDGGSLAADGAATRDVAYYIPQIDTLWFAAPTDSLTGVTSPARLAAPVHQLDDTKHRRIRYRAVATSRFSENFPEPGLDFTRSSDGLLVDVPSSARPVVPDVLYVLPTFGWERQESTNVKTDVRLGNGLRVYLNRPWYSSGEGEQLAVVLWPQSRPAPSDADRDTFKGWFTQWGLDPIWAGGDITETPTTQQFPLAATTATDLTLQETPLRVDAAGHTMGYDSSRRLWYCDIEFSNADAYSPLVRLALARFQPRSIAGTELSHVVLADFAQLAPNRSASLSVDPANLRVGRLFVGGLAPSGPTQSVVTVSVEKRDPNIASDLSWSPAPLTEVRVIADSPEPSETESVLWVGSIVFTKDPPGGLYRVVVREFELIEIDPMTGAGILNPMDFGERLVYASIIAWDF
jgi:hypothetical protein